MNTEPDILVESTDKPDVTDHDGGTRGLISQIVHGSFVDGHGVRTTVFLKGCPLRCVWCCNPEGQRAVPELRYTAALCTGCGKCVPICPTGAMSLEDVEGKPRVKIDRGGCDDCGRCIDECYFGALGWFGSYYTVDELFEEVRKDEQFYSASGGGVTIGGGEPTFQPVFLRRFLKKCRDQYIHTALDTCLYTASEEGMKALEEADLLLCDIKGLDPEQHGRDTGATNEIILQNLRRLSGMRKPMIIRVPLIPGRNDDPQSLRAIAEFVSSLTSVERVDLLPVHEYGRVKYLELGKDYRLVVEAIPAERQEEIKCLFQERGLNTQIGG